MSPGRSGANDTLAALRTGRERVHEERFAPRTDRFQALHNAALGAGLDGHVLHRHHGAGFGLHHLRRTQGHLGDCEGRENLTVVCMGSVSPTTSRPQCGRAGYA